MNKKVKCKHDIYAGSCYFCKDLPKYGYLKVLGIKEEIKVMAENKEKGFKLCTHCNKESQWCHGFCTKCHYKWKKGDIKHTELGDYSGYMKNREADKLKKEDKPASTQEDAMLKVHFAPATEAWADDEPVSLDDKESSITLTINLDEYPELLEKLKESALLHVRPVEYQIIKYAVDGLKAEGFIEKEKNEL
jgi:hypothetical protein